MTTARKANVQYKARTEHNVYTDANVTPDLHTILARMFARVGTPYTETEAGTK